MVEALEQLKIPFYVCGSVASSAHGIIRATADVDLVAAVMPQHIPELVSELGKEFYVDPDMIRKALAAGRSFNLIHFATAYKFDIFPVGEGPFEQAQFQRRAIAPVRIEGAEQIQVPIASVEDTLLSKLAWFRAGGEVSDRQWHDVRGIVEVKKGQLDLPYLRHWAAYLRLEDLLDRVFAQSSA